VGDRICIGVNQISRPRRRSRDRGWTALHGRRRLNLVFIDTYRSYTSYTACWTRGAGRRCWHRTTGRRKHKSFIFTAAPSSVGTYRATWYVHSGAVASWTFDNAIGD
jgi:hypothetical protein